MLSFVQIAQNQRRIADLCQKENKLNNVDLSDDEKRNIEERIYDLKQQKQDYLIANEKLKNEISMKYLASNTNFCLLLVRIQKQQEMGKKFVILFAICCARNNCCIFQLCFQKVLPIKTNLQQRKINVIVFRTNNLSSSN